MSLHVGRISLDEGPLRAFEEQWSTDGRSVNLSGVLFSDPTRSRARMAQLHDDILGLPLSLVPVRFDVKSHRDGYYQVAETKSSIVELDDQNLIQLTWEIRLDRRGADSEVDIESRLAGPINRLNDFELAGERWHAPAGSSSAYWVGFETPGQVIRTGDEGPIVVYRDLGQDVNPRWYCPVEDYGLGRVRILDLGERAGTDMELGSVWSLENSLTRVGFSGSGLAFAWYNGTDWSDNKIFNLTSAGDDLAGPLAVSVLHNEYERVTVRCVWNVSPSGRVYADLTLRRGARYLEILMRASAATTLGIALATPEAGVGGAGFVAGSSNDADGNRYVIGSLRSFTGDLGAGGITKESSTRLDAIIGAQVGGSSAIAGDLAADLMVQYVGTPDETVQAVRR